jgi:hypothetical protein
MYHVPALLGPSKRMTKIWSLPVIPANLVLTIIFLQPFLVVANTPHHPYRQDDDGYLKHEASTQTSFVNGEYPEKCQRIHGLVANIKAVALAATVFALGLSL